VNDTHREQLSALTDDELDREQSLFLLRRIAADGELAERFRLYAMIGDSLRGVPVSSDDLASRVRAATAGEVRPAAPTAPAVATGGASAEASGGAPVDGGRGDSAAVRPAAAAAAGWSRRLRPAATAAAAAVVAVVAISALRPADAPPQQLAEEQGESVDIGYFPPVPVAPAVDPSLPGVQARAEFASYLIKHRIMQTSAMQPRFTLGESVYSDMVVTGSGVAQDGAAGAPFRDGTRRGDAPR
jgi:sigma-E factor negative regulatory protein RseA